MSKEKISISMIAAVAANMAIGKGNSLPWHIPEDFKHFKSLTSGKPVIMGRKTFESIGRPLPNRTNIVISSKDNYCPEGVTVVSSLDEAITYAVDTAIKSEIPELFIIGGSSVYNQALPKADTIYLTEIDTVISDADAFFPKLTPAEWLITEIRDAAEKSDNIPSYKFVKYARKK